MTTRSALGRFGLGFDRLHGIFDDIGQRLPQLPPVANKFHIMWPAMEFKLDVGMSHLVQEQGVTGDVRNGFATKNRFGHPRE